MELINYFVFKAKLNVLMLLIRKKKNECYEYKQMIILLVAMRIDDGHDVDSDDNGR